MRKHLFSLVAVAVSAALTLTQTDATAKIRLPQIIGDHMVLQQQSSANIWGTATPSAKVNVKVSWSNEKHSTVADKDGKWKIAINTPSASYNKESITISDKDGAVTLTDILIGEVWLCGGQSNMEMPLEGFYACPIEAVSYTHLTLPTICSV